MTILLLSCSAQAVLLSADYVPMIREDRVWEYSGATRHGMHEYDESSWSNLLAVHSVKFDGEIEIGGKIYSRLAIFETKNYSISDDVEKYPYGTLMSEEERDATICWLCEKDGVVYRLDCNYGPVFSIDMESVSTYHDTVIYDWTKEEGEDIYLSRVPIGNIETEPFQVHYLDEMSIDGEQCRVMTFVDDGFPGAYYQDLFFIIEGIGVTYNGSLGYYYLAEMTGMADNRWEPGVQSRLERVYDGNGNVIYIREGSFFVGIDNITDTATAAPQSGVIYDLMGRRVERVQPGTVYVRDGRKFVGK